MNPANLMMTRREALIVGAAVGLTALNSASTSHAQSKPATETPWIDAHSHIWPLETDKFPLAPGKTKTDLNPPNFTDDELMSRSNIESLHSFYAGAPRELRRIAPRDIGQKKIGHFGFFRRRAADALWPLAGQWLASFAPVQAAH